MFLTRSLFRKKIPPVFVPKKKKRTFKFVMGYIHSTAQTGHSYRVTHARDNKTKELLPKCQWMFDPILNDHCYFVTHIKPSDKPYRNKRTHIFPMGKLAENARNKNQDIENQKCDQSMDFTLHYSSQSNEVFLKKPDPNLHLPPREYLFGEISTIPSVEQLTENFILERIDWLPVLRLQSLLRPVDENLNVKNLFTLDNFERQYSLERTHQSDGTEILESVRKPHPLFDKPFVLSDSVMLSKMIERAQDSSNLPAITPIPGENANFTFSKFYEIMDCKSKELTEQIFSSKSEILDCSNQPNSTQITENDIVEPIESHAEFVESLLIQRPSLIDEKIKKQVKLKTNTKTHSKRTTFVREVKFREDIPQFEALRNNMAFKYSFELDPFQKEAILLLEQQQNVLVSAHTSAGKTAVAEYAIAMSFKHGMKTIYTSPIKALSNQKYKDFKKSFDSVGIITGDIQLNPNASCVIMTTEILRAMLYHGGSASLTDIEWVVFDEVHYINDEQRGVVWEELLIMLPREIKLVLLSATFPNCYDFANWIGSTRQQVINVIMTSKRPVPLEHYVYTATDRSHLDDIFKISDEHGRFKKEGICKAIESLENKSNKSKSSKNISSPKFKNITPNKCEGIKCLTEYLIKNDNIPAIFFVFSKDACMHFAKLASSQDFTTKIEKSQIISFFNSSINRLSSDNLNLPQIRDVKLCLERGIAVHHSGILPILREIVEILFQKSLVKVLFATETFSIGVNVPARTVVFLSLNKPSDIGWRDLYPSEYIQMAGRSGRRGKDKFGTVIIVSSDKSELESIEGIINGEPFVVKSKFCLTYGLILRMLSKTSGNIVKVEDLMRSSFSEFGGESKDDSTNGLLERVMVLENDILSLNNEVSDCSICGSHLSDFYNFSKELMKLQNDALASLLCAPSTTKEVLKTGRLCLIKLTQTKFSLGVVSEEYGNAKFLNNNSKGRSIPMLVFVGDSHILKHTHLSKTLSAPITNLLFPYFKLNNTAVDGCSRVFYLNVYYSNISVVFDEIVKVNWKKISRDPYIVTNKETAHAKSSVINELLARLGEIAENVENSSVLNYLTPLDLNKYANNFDDSYTITRFMEMLTTLWENITNNEIFKCMNCPDFQKHYDVYVSIDKKKSEIDDIKFKLSDESLQLLPEYNSRITILCELGFIDSQKNLLLKGRLSNKFRNNYEIILTELLLSMELSSLQPAYVAAALSCFVQENSSFKQKPIPKFTPDLEKVWNMVLTLNEKILIVEQKFGLEFNKRYIYPDLIIPIFHWSCGTPFCDVVTKYKIAEGNLVRHILRLDEICSEMELASLYAGNPELNELIKKTRESIHKDIIFTPSLYLT